MAVEIVFPIEFLVRGTPVSLQVKRAATKIAWQAHVRLASRAALPEGHFTSPRPVAITLLYFPNAAMQGDIDNIVKPVLDALCRHVYDDDRQVERVWVQKFEPDRDFPFANPSRTLTLALEAEKPLLFVRISDNLNERLF